MINLQNAANRAQCVGSIVRPDWKFVVAWTEMSTNTSSDYTLWQQIANIWSIPAWKLTVQLYNTSYTLEQSTSVSSTTLWINNQPQFKLDCFSDNQICVTIYWHTCLSSPATWYLRVDHLFFNSSLSYVTKATPVNTSFSEWYGSVLGNYVCKDIWITKDSSWNEYMLLKLTRVQAYNAAYAWYYVWTTAKNSSTTTNIVNWTTFTYGDSGRNQLLNSLSSNNINYAVSIFASARNLLITNNSTNYTITNYYPTASFIMEWYNWIFYFIYKYTDGSIRYRIIDTITATLWSENILISATTWTLATNFVNYTRFKNSTSDYSILLQHWLYNSYSNTIIQQNISTNLLSVQLSSMNTITVWWAAADVFYTGAELIATQYNAVNKFRIIDANTLVVWTEFTIPSSWTDNQAALQSIMYYVATYLQGDYWFNRHNALWMISRMHINPLSTNKLYSTLHSNTNTPSSFYNAQALYIYSSYIYVTSNWYSINFSVPQMVAFRFDPTNTIPSGTTLTYKYSTNNGWSFTSLPTWTVITPTAGSITLKLNWYFVPTTTATPILDSYTLTIYK